MSRQLQQQYPGHSGTPTRAQDDGDPENKTVSRASGTLAFGDTLLTDTTHSGSAHGPAEAPCGQFKEEGKHLNLVYW